MSDHRRTSPTPPLLTKPFHALFAQAYVDHACNGTEAYRSLRPTCKYVTAMSQACRLRKKPPVAEEIGRLLRARCGITREQIESDLLTSRELALASGDPTVIDANAMNRAKLAGFLVEKREITTLTDERKTALRSLLARMLPPSTPSGLTHEGDRTEIISPSPLPLVVAPSTQGMPAERTPEGCSEASSTSEARVDAN